MTKGAAIPTTPMDAEAWAELYRLRAEQPWKEVALAERLRRIEAERAAPLPGELPAVVVAHCKDLQRCVHILDEAGMRDTANEVERAIQELRAALSAVQPAQDN